LRSTRLRANENRRHAPRSHRAGELRPVRQDEQTGAADIPDAIPDLFPGRGHETNGLILRDRCKVIAVVVSSRTNLFHAAWQFFHIAAASFFTVRTAQNRC
jgi:hypothetical protein